MTLIWFLSPPSPSFLITIVNVALGPFIRQTDKETQVNKLKSGLFIDSLKKLKSDITLHNMTNWNLFGLILSCYKNTVLILSVYNFHPDMFCFPIKVNFVLL